MGYPMHVYWNFYCSPAKNMVRTPTFFGLATPLPVTWRYGV